MPGNQPPAGGYNSSGDNPNGPNALWSGSFTYDDASNTVNYTRRDGQQFNNVPNQANGNAFNFTLDDTAHFVLPNPGNQGGKATYKGQCNVNPSEAWTATQN